jgi:hypothetical protein
MLLATSMPSKVDWLNPANPGYRTCSGPETRTQVKATRKYLKVIKINKIILFRPTLNS